MSKKIILGIIILALAMSGLVWNATTPTTAQSPLDEYNPPLGTPEDNECNEGGTMYPHCINEDLWICGWIMARYNRDIIPLEQVPERCLPEPLPTTVEDGPVCVPVGEPNCQEFECLVVCTDSCGVITEIPTCIID